MSEQAAEPLQVSDVLVQTTDFLAALGWQKLGLRPDMVTGQIHPDLAQAKMAIDALAALAQVMEPSLSEEDKRQLRNEVNNLRINYVEKVQG